jgi:hypothetical protein
LVEHALTSLGTWKSFGSKVAILVGSLISGIPVIDCCLTERGKERERLMLLNVVVRYQGITARKIYKHWCAPWNDHFFVTAEVAFV